MLATWMLGKEKAGEIVESAVRVGQHRMHYLKTGSGPELILLHGLLGTADAWTPSLDRLGKNSTVYAIDSLGLGGSDRVAGLDASLEATAARVITFMDAAGIDQADILGTSHGGAVAMALAAEWPGRVRTLILHAPANPFSALADPLLQFYRTRLGRWFANRLPFLPRNLQNLALGRMYGDRTQVEDGSVDRYIDSLRVPGTIDHILRIIGGWSADMRHLRSVLPRLNDIQALLLWGTHDRAVCLESAEQLQKYFKKSELLLIPGAGHLPYEEAPEMFCEAVNGFLRHQIRSELPQRLHLITRSSAA